MRRRASFSPAGGGSGSSDAIDGIRPGASLEGTGTLRGAPSTSRRGTRDHARQNGVNTTYGLSTAAMKFPGTRRASTPSAPSAASTARSRATANGDTSGA